MRAPPEKSYATREELLEDVKRFAMAEGYAVTIKRSDKGKRVVLKCEQGGLYRPNDSCPPARQTISRLIGCPFDLYATFSKETNNWTVSVRNGSHNHEASPHASGHSVNRRLNT
ncbi:hypothetical protein PsorP6_005786 [Peronosclerospora sorghi]|uniref:Uncharacterized protein n=1 Tax=Peronosclerospora sorghi TaxID=230839 RepID=A0ACC0W3U3_9STRA|nr:hypothetical protein PsorP6_005786 [Peronosclerospora sorghi]